MGDSEKNAVRNFYETVINRQNTVIANSLMTEDFKMHDPPPGYEGTRDGTKKFFMELFKAFPDMKLKVDQMVNEGDMVAVRVSGGGMHKGAFMGMPPSNKKINMNGMEIWRVTGGRVAESWGVWDTAGMLQQLGVMPSPAAGAGSR